MLSRKKRTRFLHLSVDSVFVIRYTRHMKRLILIVTLCIIPTGAFSHPGKTDLYGGHKCIKGCEEWNLYYTEYHLHDKDGKPIRIAKKRRASKDPGPAKIETAVTETVLPAPLVTAKTQTVTVYRYVTNVYEENILGSNPLLWVLLILLLLLLILRMNRKREEN